MIWERTINFKCDNNKNKKWIFKDNYLIKEFNVQVAFSKLMDTFSLKNK